MYRGAIEVLKPLIHEGKIYYIESFTVKDANRTYRPVSNDFMILFSKWTTLEECIDIPADFPTITFSLTHFQEIPSLVGKNIFYVGMIYYYNIFIYVSVHCLIRLIYSIFMCKQILWASLLRSVPHLSCVQGQGMLIV